MKGFLHTHDIHREEIIDQNDGEKATLIKRVEREILPLDDEAWDDPEYLMSMLRPEVGNCQPTRNGKALQRTVFLRGSNGPENPRTGRPYSSLRTLRLIQGHTDPDPETGETKLWTMLVLEGANDGNRQQQSQQDQTPAPEASQTSEDAPESDSDAEEVSEQVESL